MKDIADEVKLIKSIQINGHEYNIKFYLGAADMKYFLKKGVECLVLLDLHIGIKGNIGSCMQPYFISFFFFRASFWILSIVLAPLSTVLHDVDESCLSCTGHLHQIQEYIELAASIPRKIAN